MEIIIERWGHDAAVVLPKSALAKTGLSIGDKVIAQVCKGEIVLAPSRKRYSLVELVTQCDLREPVPDDDVLWENALTVGRERV